MTIFYGIKPADHGCAERADIYLRASAVIWELEGELQQVPGGKPAFRLQAFTQNGKQALYQP